MKFSRKDGQFVFNAFIIALVLMAIMHAFAPYMGLSQNKLQEISDLRRQLVVMGPQELEQKLVSMNAQPTLLVVYASWCKYCRQMMPGLMEMLRNGEMEGVNVIFLSKDRSGEDLAPYLVRNDYHRLVTPYVERGEESGEIRQMLQAKGSAYRGSIPFVLVFDAQGRWLFDLPGISDRNRLLGAAAQAMHKTR